MTYLRCEFDSSLEKVRQEIQGIETKINSIEKMIKEFIRYFKQILMKALILSNLSMQKNEND